MRRIVSVWLPIWPVERLKRHAPHAVPDDAPLALVESGARGVRITAVNAVAAREGVQTGVSLADARAALPSLLSRPAEPQRDRAALLKLARWAGRYGPLRHAEDTDGIWIDVTGVAHLFGGEKALLRDLTHRLARFGITAEAGLAGTIGAAHALARFAPRGSRISAPGHERQALAHLPVAALRLETNTVLLLRRLGLRRIGQLYDLPRASLEKRFGSEASSRSKAERSARLAGAVLTRLDQALGLRDEPLKGLGEPPILSRRRSWSEPLISSEALENETSALVSELCSALKETGLGCRRLRLILYRADGTVAEISAGLSRASRTPAHLMRLIKEKLQAADAGFGIDVAALEALAVERMGPSQIAFGREGAASKEDALAALADRIANKLGAARLTCLVPYESHIPEHAERRVAPSSQNFSWANEAAHIRNIAPRPPFLLDPPEPITVMAEIPEGAPLTFSWRRVRHRIVRSEGPERIAPEWWRELSARGPLTAGGSPASSRTRDYYQLDDETGARFWVFREGLYRDGAEDGAPSWFLHGLFG